MGNVPRLLMMLTLSSSLALVACQKDEEPEEDKAEDKTEEPAEEPAEEAAADDADEDGAEAADAPTKTVVVPKPTTTTAKVADDKTGDNGTGLKPFKLSKGDDTDDKGTTTTKTVKDDDKSDDKTGDKTGDTGGSTTKTTKTTGGKVSRPLGIPAPPGGRPRPGG